MNSNQQQQQLLQELENDFGEKHYVIILFERLVEDNSDVNPLHILGLMRTHECEFNDIANSLILGDVGVGDQEDDDEAEVLVEEEDVILVIDDVGDDENGDIPMDVGEDENGDIPMEEGGVDIDNAGGGPGKKGGPNKENQAPSSWWNMTVTQLKAELKNRNLSQQGKKKKLVERLEKADGAQPSTSGKSNKEKGTKRKNGGGEKENSSGGRELTTDDIVEIGELISGVEKLVTSGRDNLKKSVSARAEGRVPTVHESTPEELVSAIEDIDSMNIAEMKKEVMHYLHPTKALEARMELHELKKKRDELDMRIASEHAMMKLAMEDAIERSKQRARDYMKAVVLPELLHVVHVAYVKMNVRRMHRRRDYMKAVVLPELLSVAYVKMNVRRMRRIIAGYQSALKREGQGWNVVVQMLHEKEMVLGEECVGEEDAAETLVLNAREEWFRSRTLDN